MSRFAGWNKVKLDKTKKNSPLELEALALGIRIIESEKKNKYNRNRAVYLDIKYDSIVEAIYAALLDLRKNAGDIVGWTRQIKFPLVVNNTKICDYKIDFCIETRIEEYEYVEIKGMALPEFKNKWKHFRAQYPELNAYILRKSGKNFKQVDEKTWRILGSKKRKKK